LKLLTQDPAEVVEAIKNSTKVALNSDNTMVKRIEPIPEKDTTLPRSIYSKGWPLDTTTLESAHAFYEPYGKVLSISLRRRKNKAFKGSMIIEFSDEKEALEALTASPSPPDVKLVYSTKATWLQENLEQKEKYNKEQEATGGSKKRKAEKEVEELSYRKGLIIHFQDIGPNQSFDTVKDLLNKYGVVSFLEFKANQTSGYARYADEESATKALNEVKDIGGKAPVLRILKGEEEEAYWANIKSGGGKTRDGGRGGRGGRGGKGGRGRGRGRGKGRGGRGAKRVKVE